MSVIRLKRQVAVNGKPDLGAVLVRIASATSVIRTRSEDALRLDVNGGTSRDVLARYAAAATQLERVAASLESTVA